MGAVNPQKIKLLKLYEILRQHTDEDRPLSTNQLCSMLEAEGITCDRRTLAEDIDILNANGFEVLRRRTRYAMLFYIVDRRFDLAEVKILIDAIQAASFITKQKTIELTDKVASLAGSHKAAVLKENLVSFNTRKHTNEAIYYTVDALERALRQKLKASFQYFDLDENGNRVLRKNSERYVVNPVGLVYHEDNYYFVTYHETHEATVNYRVDRMANAQVEDETVAAQAIGLSEELGVYTERIFKMFSSPQATVELPQAAGTDQPEAEMSDLPQQTAAAATAEPERVKAPDFTVQDMDGKEVKLSDFIGRPVVINFWASWCPPCKVEMPEFEQVYQELGGEVAFLMIDLVDGQRETKEKGAEYVQGQGFTFPVYFDFGEAATAYGVRSIPTTYFIDARGYLIAGAQTAIDAQTLHKGIALINK